MGPTHELNAMTRSGNSIAGLADRGASDRRAPNTVHIGQIALAVDYRSVVASAPDPGGVPTQVAKVRWRDADRPVGWRRTKGPRDEGGNPRHHGAAHPAPGGS